jgi:hypothetical protein
LADEGESISNQLWRISNHEPMREFSKEIVFTLPALRQMTTSYCGTGW